MMTSLKIHPFLILLLISLPIFAAAGQRSKISLVSGAHQIIATIYRQGQGFGENEVLSFRSSAGGEALRTMKSNGFERPVLFSYHGENFIHVSTTPSGSGAFVTDTIFWIAPDATMHEIELESAAEAYEDKVDAEETVLGGGSGVNCNGGKLKFAFYIANDADPHCCPTAGKVTGNYEIIGKKKFDPITKQYRSTFRMVVKQYSRTPISSGENFFAR
ncbi:MAG TPA: hypothetical protein VI958_11900 [Acidobacteriota bacterium]